MPLICAQMMIGSTIDASGMPPPSGSTPSQYLRRGGTYEMRLPHVYIEPHARWISTPPRTASTPTATEESETCAVRVAAGWMEPRRADWLRAPKAHLGLGGDKIVPRARHERRLELAREPELDAASHRAAWGLCGLESLGVRDER